MSEKINEVNYLKLIIYKLIREKRMNNRDVRIMEEIVNEKDYQFF